MILNFQSDSVEVKLIIKGPPQLAIRTGWQKCQLFFCQVEISPSGNLAKKKSCQVNMILKWAKTRQVSNLANCHMTLNWATRQLPKLANCQNALPKLANCRHSLNAWNTCVPKIRQLPKLAKCMVNLERHEIRQPPKFAKFMAIFR